MNWTALPFQSLAFCSAMLIGFLAAAQPKSGLRLPEPIDPVEAARAGKTLVSDLLSQVPEGASSTSGTLSTRTRQGKTTVLQVEFLVQPTPSNFVSRYIARDAAGGLIADLRIVQSPGQTNSYFFASGTDVSLRPLSSEELMRPFAGSEFWLADLGLEFLHWPIQMVIGKEMSRGQFCEVLESRPGSTLKNGYSKVVSWIASQRPGVVIVRAEAYDTDGRVLKQFDPKNLQRVQGQWQLQRMQMYNRQTGARSTIDFDLGPGSANP